MNTNLLYPDCDFGIWSRSASEDNVTEQPIEGKTIGIIPNWITGCLYQNGPGLLDVTGERVEHLFDAFSLIQKFTINNGRVTYQNRILQSDAYQKAHRTGQAHYSEYGTAKSTKLNRIIDDDNKTETTLQWFCSRFRNLMNYKDDFRTDNALISVYPYRIQHDQLALFAMTETPIMHEIDQVTIETRSQFNTSDHLPVVTHCAHPVLLSDGTIYNIGLNTGLTGMNYVLFEFPGQPKQSDATNFMHQCRVLAKIPSRWPFNPTYMHAFAVTENYVILVEQSLCISIAQVFQLKITHGPMTDALIWYGNEPVRFRLINRHTMTEHDSYVYLTSPFFFLHIINAYEDGNYLVIDLCCYENADMLKCMTIDALETAQQNPNYYKQFRGRPKRFLIPLVLKNDNLINLNYTECQVKFLDKQTLWIEPEMIVDLGCELPQIEYNRFYGKFYRYFYAINSDIEYKYCGAIRKVNILEKSCKIWHEEGCYTSEAIFIQNPECQTADEDDGVLLISLLRSSQEHEISLVVLDAKHMTEIGRVQFDTNGPVPKCLHGLWIDSNN